MLLIIKKVSKQFPSNSVQSSLVLCISVKMLLVQVHVALKIL
jgi:hypothetical protein